MLALILMSAFSMIDLVSLLASSIITLASLRDFFLTIDPPFLDSTISGTEKHNRDGHIPYM